VKDIGALLDWIATQPDMGGTANTTEVGKAMAESLAS
jgi:hypothetical protein